MGLSSLDSACSRAPVSRYEGFVPGFSFACGLRPHAKLSRRIPLACSFVGSQLAHATSCDDRSVPGFSFACGLRPHAKRKPGTPLACAFEGSQCHPQVHPPPPHPGALALRGEGSSPLNLIAPRTKLKDIISKIIILKSS